MAQWPSCNCPCGRLHGRPRPLVGLPLLGHAAALGNALRSSAREPAVESDVQERERLLPAGDAAKEGAPLASPDVARLPKTTSKGR
mmetsp:Transcript_127140/g.354023  ORF Transcript_127140/g.354023 Transcript_127140/m.354023 type:complete len:86 (-) Transcript_127140:190-447(-)